MKLVTAHQMREVDRVTISERGIPGRELMEAAGRAVALDIAESFPKGPVCVVAGKGNNGGDGFVIARFLHRAGWRVEVLIASPPEAGDAFGAWSDMPEALPRRRLAEIGDLADYLEQFDLLVDAILGTGSRLPLETPWDAVVTAMNAARFPIVAVDIPTGLDPDTGEAPLAIHAARTVTIGLPKIGMVTGKGPDLCGAVRTEAILFPADLLSSTALKRETLTLNEAKALLPQRPRDGHKGTFGRVAIVAGSAAMPGAAQLSALGALRSGAGLVQMACPSAIHALLAPSLPEVILGEALGSTHVVAPPPAMMKALGATADAAVIGPGLGQHPETFAAVGQLLGTLMTPLVVDADALNWLATWEEEMSPLRGIAVLTPHPGEAARLLRCTTAEVQEDRWGAAEALAMAFGQVVVLKGSGTLVAHPSGWTTHIPSGNSALARGGSGDLLAGLIGGLLAQLPMAEARRAAILGAFVHGLAADIAAESGSPRGLRVTEVADALPAAWRRMELA